MLHISEDLNSLNNIMYTRLQERVIETLTHLAYEAPHIQFSNSESDPYECFICFDHEKPNKTEFMKVYESVPWKQLRQERDKRLADADWVTLRAYSSGTDVPEEWMTYMQALRDLPSVTKDPTNPVWPEPPNPSLVGEKMEKLAPRVSFLETSVASLISLDKQLNYKNAEMEILDIKVKNIESRLGMIEETLTSILSKLNI